MFLETKKKEQVKSKSAKESAEKYQNEEKKASSVKT